MPLPPYYLEVLLGGGMTCVAVMMMYGRGILQMLFESFTKGPGGFPNIFIITGKGTTLEPIYGPTFVDHGVFVLGETSRFLMVLLPLKWVCIQYLPQIFSNAFKETLGVWYNYVTLGFNFIGSGLGTCGSWLLAPSLTSPVDLVSLFFHLVQSPPRIFTIGKSFPEMLHFFLEEFRIAADSLDPVGKGANDTIFCWEMVVAVPL